jgi:23S rRNA (uridine2552-2'-O)-methyltransferase
VRALAARNIFFLQRGYIYDKHNKMNGNRWDDHYARQARAEKWLARSVYKLQEIDRKYGIIRKGCRLLDLGCYPGSWSQYGIKKVGPQGDVVGIDLTRPADLSLPNFTFIQADVFTLDIEWLGREVGPRDLVMSDLGTRTTGVRLTDTSRSMRLARRALEIALAILEKKGHFVCKVFEGEDLKSFRSDTSLHFRKMRLFRPKATRKRSREVYLVGLELV